MIFLDAYCLVALARDEAAAQEVEELMRSGQTAISAVNLFEVVDFLVRRAGVPQDDVRVQLSHLLGEIVQVIPVTEDEAWRGASLRARHYAKGACEVSLADCVLLASVGEGESIATSDPSVADVARAEDIGVVALPDTRGRRP